MAQRNEFGRSCQSAREVLGITLLEFARKVGVSPSFVCALEMGIKPAPEGYLDKAASILRLDENAKRRLSARELRSREHFRIDHATLHEANLIAAFIENRGSLDLDRLRKATEVLQGSFNFEADQ